MTIDMLDMGTILVSLCEDDMRDYMLDFSAGVDQSSTRRGLTRLMYRVGEECGLDHRDKSYLIEALPSRGGCLLIISVHVVKRRRLYRIKRERCLTVCRFDSADAMLDWLGRAGQRRFGYRIYLYNGGYVLLPEAPLCAADAAALSEYGHISGAGAVCAARVREFGRLLLERRSMRRQPKNVSSAAI